MRTIWRTLGREGIRDIAPVCLASGVVGASFGAIAVGAGLPLWLPVLLSFVVFGGASQFLFIGIIAAGGSPIAAVVAGLLVNSRHLPFGMALGDVFGSGLLRRIAGSHLMIDESVAFALAEREPDRRSAAYWACGLGLFVCWNTGVLLGTVGGTIIGDPDAFGLDAAFPAVLLALVLPALRDVMTMRAALTGALIALATSMVLPAGLPVLLGLTGLVVAVPRTKVPA